MTACHGEGNGARYGARQVQLPFCEVGGSSMNAARGVGRHQIRPACCREISCLMNKFRLAKSDRGTNTMSRGPSSTFCPKSLPSKDSCDVDRVGPSGSRRIAAQQHNFALTGGVPKSASCRNRGRDRHAGLKRDNSWPADFTTDENTLRPGILDRDDDVWPLQLPIVQVPIVRVRALFAFVRPPSPDRSLAMRCGHRAGLPRTGRMKDYRHSGSRASLLPPIASLRIFARPAGNPVRNGEAIAVYRSRFNNKAAIPTTPSKLLFLCSE